MYLPDLKLFSDTQKKIMYKPKQPGYSKIIFHTGIILLAAWFGASGFVEITKNPIVWNHTIKMGYPPFFIVTLGIAKLLGVVVLLIPNKLSWLKEWVFAALFIDVVFAGVSVYHYSGISGMIKPLVAFILILTTYIMFRKIYPSLQLSFD